MPANIYCWGSIEHVPNRASVEMCRALAASSGGIFRAARVLGAPIEPPMTNQLTDLGRQALSQGANRTAESFFKKALELDPANDAATDGLSNT